MPIKQIFRTLVKKLLASRGYTLTTINPTRATMDNACRAIADRKHDIQTVIDIGASDGRWSQTFRQYYPKAQYILIEAQPIHETALKRYCKQNTNSQYVLAAAGETNGQIYFDATHALGGLASYTPFEENNIIVPVTTVDAEIQKHQLAKPYLLKLDTHGFEIPILNGAKQTLQNTEVLLIECYNYKIAPECLLFDEMCAHLRKLGFRCIDLVDPLFRPYDNTLWQMDLVFVRKDWPGFTYLQFE